MAPDGDNFLPGADLLVLFDENGASIINLSCPYRVG